MHRRVIYLLAIAGVLFLGLGLCLILRLMYFTGFDKSFIMTGKNGVQYAKLNFKIESQKKNYDWPWSFGFHDDAHVQFEFKPLNEYAQKWYAADVFGQDWMCEAIVWGLYEERISIILRKRHVKDGPHLTFMIFRDKALWINTTYGSRGFGYDKEEYGFLIPKE